MSTLQRIICFISAVLFLVVFIRPIMVFAQENRVTATARKIDRPAKRGDGICDVERGEYYATCPQDCTQQQVYDYFEKKCIERKWSKITFDVNGVERKTLWKGPKTWENGAIIIMHGGGGAYSNFCANVPDIGKPMENFGPLAIEEGFAVFSLDSDMGLRTDKDATFCGKRFDFVAGNSSVNADLAFIKRVITETIPKLRPGNSSHDIFIAGHSTGAYMTTLAATHYDYLITAFAPVAGGDPYGVSIDCSLNPLGRNTPGIVYNKEKHQMISEIGACETDDYPNELEWPATSRTVKPAFKQFYHQGDRAIDISCVKQATRLLVKHGYKDDGIFIIKNYSDRRTVLKHLWQEEYNKPLLDFFKRQANK